MIENCTSENEIYILVRVCDIMTYIGFGKGGAGNSHVRITAKFSEGHQKWLATFRGRDQQTTAGRLRIKLAK